MTLNEMIFELRNVIKTYTTREGKAFNALDGVNLQLKRGKAYAVVGESGSGKTTLGRIMTGLVKPSSGSVVFEGREVSSWIKKDSKAFAHKVQIIFQNPYQSLNPKWEIVDILQEGIQELPVAERKKKLFEVITQVNLKEEYLSKKPGNLSGGERQRVAIARSLLMKPEYLILDEPTSQLDVSIQAGVMDLLKKLKNEMPGGLLFITHDIALASMIADEIIVIRDGAVIEEGEKAEIIRSPKDDYTKNLLGAIPKWPPSFV